jgi:hypothetical protein
MNAQQSDAPLRLDGETVAQWLVRWQAMRKARPRARPLGPTGVMTAATKRGRTSEGVALFAWAAIFNGGKVPHLARILPGHPAEIREQAAWLALCDEDRALLGTVVGDGDVQAEARARRRAVRLARSDSTAIEGALT